MNFTKLFSLKFKYLINKSFLFVLFVICFLVLVLFYNEALNATINNSYSDSIDLYISNAFMYLKLILVFFSAYLFSYTISVKNDFLIYLLMPLNVSKTRSLLMSILIDFIIIFIILLFFSLFLIYIAFFIIESFFIEVDFLFSIINVFMIVLIYGLFSLLFMQFINNSFSLIMVICLFVFSNNLYENNDFSYIMYFLPNVNYEGDAFVSFLYLFVYIVFLILVNIIVYNKRDLNY